MKGFKLLALVMLTLVLFTANVMAEDFIQDDFVTVDYIKINGQVADVFSPVHLEREEEVMIEVFFTGNPYGKCTVGNSNSCYNTKVTAEVEGYEYGDIRDVEGPFEVEPGVQYRKLLRLKLPEDMKASDDLQLNVEIKDDDDLVLTRFPLRIQEIRHKLNVFDAIFNPSNNLQAGQPLFTSIRLENLGDNVETSIKVTVAIPSLGIQTSEYVDRLSTLAVNNDEDTKDSATSNDLLLMIPQNTLEGDYNVIVTLEYNRGRSLEQKTYKMHVKGAQVVQTQPTKQPAMNVNVDYPAQKVTEGNGAVFKLTVGNLGQEAQAYTFEVLGVSDWANTRVEPTTLVVQPNTVGDAYIYVAPKPETNGIKTFTVKVMSNGAVVSEKNLSLEVTPKTNGKDLKTIFTWIFVILLGILVILVIVVLAKKYSSKEEKNIEGQTYY